MAATDLCALTDVRLLMETATADTDLDLLIQFLIPVASERIVTEVQRELTPTASATRVFKSEGRVFDLAPYDLRTVTTVTLDPNDQAAVLTQHTDYKLLPHSSRWGTFTRLRLSRYIARSDATLARFGFAELSIAGAWGMASVPQIALDACALTVRAWIDRSAIRAAYVDDSLGGLSPVPGTYALPPAARNMIQPLKRFNVV